MHSGTALRSSTAPCELIDRKTFDVLMLKAVCDGAYGDATRERHDFSAWRNDISD
jgi:hypothetical protein